MPDYEAIVKQRAERLTADLRRTLVALGCDAGDAALARVDQHGIAHVRHDLIIEAIARGRAIDGMRRCFSCEADLSYNNETNWCAECERAAGGGSQ